MYNIKNLKRLREQEKQKTSFSGLFQRFIFIFALVLFLNFFFFRRQGPVSFVLVNFGFFVFLIANFFNKKGLRKQIPSLTALLLVFLFISFSYLRSSNPLVGVLLALLMGLVLILLAYLGSTQIVFVRCLAELILAPLSTAWAYLKSSFSVLKFGLSGKWRQRILTKEKGGLGSAKSVLIGFLVGLPVVGLLLSFLAGGDPVFSFFIKKLLTEEFLRRLPGRVFLTILLLLVFSPFLFLKRKKKFVSPLNFLQQFSWVREMSVVMLMVAVVVGVFLAVQWPYVFVSVAEETNLSAYGVATYSEYVKKGFAELLQASLLVFGLIWAGLIILRGKKDKQRTVLSAIQLVVLGEFVVFLVSLFRRVWLYQQYHGWSLARIYGSFLLFWLVGMTVTLALRHFWQKKWVIIEALLAASVILFLGFFNAEHFVASQKPPTVNDRIDYVYLSRMSADGYEGWRQAFEHAEEVLVGRGYEDGLINQEERREIAYSGMIVHQLTKNYHELMKKYGTEEEWKDYFLKLLEEQEEVADREIERQKKLLAQGDKNADFYLKGAEKRKKRAREALRMIKEGKEWRKIRPLEIYRASTSFFTFNIWSDWSFYHLNSSENKKYWLKEIPSFNKRDRFFTWNWSQKRAFEKMKKEIGLEKLRLLQRRYLAFHRQIMFQRERDYERDISLRSPFLSRIWEDS